MVCEKHATNVSTNLIVNQFKAPFDNADIRKAMVLTIDRAAFNKILGHNEFIMGGSMLPPPHGVWGMPPEVLKNVAGYHPDVAANRAEAQKIMKNWDMVLTIR